MGRLNKNKKQKKIISNATQKNNKYKIKNSDMMTYVNVVHKC